MPNLPEICRMCKIKDNFYFFKAFTEVTNLMLKLKFVRLLLKWAKPIEDEFLNAFALCSKFDQRNNLTHFCSL